MAVESPVDRIIAQIGIGIIEHLVVQPVSLILAQRGLSHMPFPHHTCTVSGFLEDLGYGHGISRKSPAVSRKMIIECHPSYTGLMLV